MVVLCVGVVCVRIVLFYLTYNLPQKVVDFALRWQHLFIDLAHNQGHGPHLHLEKIGAMRSVYCVVEVVLVVFDDLADNQISLLHGEPHNIFVLLPRIHARS